MLAKFNPILSRSSVLQIHEKKYHASFDNQKS